jgi:hypothetical protein
LLSLTLYLISQLIDFGVLLAKLLMRFPQLIQVIFLQAALEFSECRLCASWPRGGVAPFTILLRRCIL